MGKLGRGSIHATTPCGTDILCGRPRLKAIKGQMYGRAGFELLEAKVLPWENSKEREPAPKVRKAQNRSGNLDD
jgi:hypothetical protein